jgi:type I restriction enzyme S subunit
MKDEFLLSILDEAVDGRLSKTYREFKGFQTKSTLNPAENGGISDESIIYPELPENWSLCSLDELTQMVGSGITPKGGKSSYLDRGVALIRSQNIRIMRLDLSDVAYISENQDEKMARTRVHYGDVLLNITGASIGRVAWFDRLDIPANVNQHVCILRLNSPIQDWVTVCLASGYGQSQIMKMQSGVTREGLNYKQVRRLVIPIPPDDERQFIIRKVNDSLDRVNIIAESVFKSEVLLETLHKSILKQAFEGNLVPQDPNDEPAEKLLARIKGEKNRGNAQSRKSLTRSHFTG